MFGHVVQADEIATVSAAEARCKVEGGLSMNNFLKNSFWNIVFIEVRTDSIPLKTSTNFFMIPLACNQSSSKTITYRLKASTNATFQSGFKHNLSKRARSSGEALNTISVTVALIRSSQSFHFKKKLERIHNQSPWLYGVPRGSAILGFIPSGLSTVTSLHRKVNHEAVFFFFGSPGRGIQANINSCSAKKTWGTTPSKGRFSKKGIEENEVGGVRQPTM